MLTSRTRRRLALALALTLLLGLVSTGPAAASPSFFSSWLSSPAQLWTNAWAGAWNFISQGWSQRSDGATPETGAALSGGSATPSKAPLEAGAGLDPIG